MFPFIDFILFSIFLFAVTLARAAALASQTTNLSHYESDHDSLPSYSIVAGGLPTYNDYIMEQMKTKITRPSYQSKRPSLTKLFNFEQSEKSVVCNYEKSSCTPKNDDNNATTSAPSYEVSVILPQKNASEKTSHHHHHQNHLSNYCQVYSSSETDSFIVNLPPEHHQSPSIHDRSKEQHSLTKSVAVSITQQQSVELLTPELNELRKGELVPTLLKVKANSVGNLCDIHR